MPLCRETIKLLIAIFHLYTAQSSKFHNDHVTVSDVVNIICQWFPRNFHLREDSHKQKKSLTDILIQDNSLMKFNLQSGPLLTLHFLFIYMSIFMANYSISASCLVLYVGWRRYMYVCLHSCARVNVRTYVIRY